MMGDMEYQDMNQLEMGDTTYNNIYDGLCYGQAFDKEEFTIDDLRTAISKNTNSGFGKAGPVFLEGVAKRLCELGFVCSAGDIEIILAEIKRRYKERIGETCPKTIQNWIRGHRTSVTNRVNNYNLCYALEMDVQETAEFFQKCFFSIPFHYKDTTDVIFYYCLGRRRPYATIRRMLEEASAFQEDTDSTTQTIEIGKRISDMDDDQEFMHYLSVHCYSREQQYQRARRAIIRLLDTHKGDGYAECHKTVMGFHYQDTMRDGAVKRHDLPEEFTRSLPTDRTFLDIKAGKKETYDTLRKVLIILSFYDFYIVPREACEVPSQEQIRERLGDFQEETDKRLLECGMVPLYVKNPFDMLMLFCANSISPLDTFYGINELRYNEQQE